MAWHDYDSVAWFVRGSSVDDPGTQGSAVAVRLRRVGAPPRTYLLTCAHVVRGLDPGLDLDSDLAKGAGPVLKTLRAWRSGSGFTGEQARMLRVVASGHARPDEPVPADQRAPSFDWILLAIEDEAEALAAPAVPHWAGPNPVGRFLVCGYPGLDPHDRDVVKPTIPDHRLSLHASDLGELKLVGDETRPGMSGGGLFDSDGVFVGIHRSRRDGELKLVAVSAAFIRRQLGERGYDVVTDELPTLSTAVAELVRILRDVAFDAVDWRGVLNRWLPRASPFSKPPNLSDDDSPAVVLQELEKLGPNERGTRPLHGFALELYRLKPAEILGKWVRENFPAEGPGQFEEREAIAPTGEPRIVLEMKPVGLPGDDPAHRTIEYKIWYFGFRRSPPSRQLNDRLDRFGAILESAWDEVRGLVDYAKVWVEVFLPKELLAWNAESHDVRIGKFPVRIGTIHPFSLRLKRENVLRLADAARPLRRYDSLQTIPKACESHVLVEVPGDADPGKVYSALSVNTNVVGVLWTSRPRTAEGDGLDVWDAVDQAGIPLVTWLREIPMPPPDLGAEFHDKKWDDLADRVKELRYAGTNSKGSWHLGHHLAVILDDDRRTHPESTPLRSPHAP